MRLQAWVLIFQACFTQSYRDDREGPPPISNAVRTADTAQTPSSQNNSETQTDYPPVSYESPPEDTKYVSAREVCLMKGPGWDLVSIQSVSHVKWLRDQGVAQGVDLTVDAGVLLGYDKTNTGSRFYDLADLSRDVTGIFDALRSEGWPGDYHTNERTSCDGEGQVYAGFGFEQMPTPGISDWGLCHSLNKIVCENKKADPGVHALKSITTRMCAERPCGWMLDLLEVLPARTAQELGLECNVQDIFEMDDSFLVAREGMQGLSDEGVLKKLPALPSGTVIHRDRSLADWRHILVQRSFQSNEAAVESLNRNVQCLVKNWKYEFRSFSLRRWHPMGGFKARMFHTDKAVQYSSVKEFPGWLTFNLPLTTIFDYLTPRALVFQLGLNNSAQLVKGRVPTQEMLDYISSVQNCKECEISNDYRSGTVAPLQDKPCAENEWKYVVMQTGIPPNAECYDTNVEDAHCRYKLKVMSRCFTTPQEVSVIDPQGDFSTIVVGKANPDPIGHVMIDAGSSGSKLFSFKSASEKPQWLKLLTACKYASFDLQGAAALAYSMDLCQGELSRFISDSEPPQAITVFDNDCMRRDFARILLDHVRELHHNVTSMSSVAVNALEVPMLATAGMRLMSRDKNDLIWGEICKRQDSSGTYRFASRSSGLCGTIPGTTEAYYEFLAFAAKSPKAQQTSKTVGTSNNASQEPAEKRSGLPLTGIFSIGGASAQIAIPLVTGGEESEFKSLMEIVRSRLSCDDTLLPSGKPIPFFNSEKQCYKDFVAMKNASEIPPHLVPEWDAWREKGKAPRFLGLVSFLGLGRLTGPPGGEMGIAGGVNMIEEFAKTLNVSTQSGVTVGCSSDSKNFDWQLCKKAFKEDLKRDLLFSEVATFFKRTRTMKSLSITRFSYNTFAAVPSKVFGGSDGMTQNYSETLKTMEENQTKSAGVAEVLEALLDTWCSGNDTEHPYVEVDDPVDDPNFKSTKVHLNQQFGFMRQKSCMTALWTATFIKELFGDSKIDMQADKFVKMWSAWRGKLRKAIKHEKKALEFHPVDWALGAMTSFIEKHEAQGTSADMDGGMIAMPSLHSSPYIHGAALLLGS